MRCWLLHVATLLLSVTQAPLLLPLFSLLPSPTTWFGRLLSVALFTGIDVLIADCLSRIAATGASYTSRLHISPRQSRAWQPVSVAAVYLFNPFTILSCLARPTTVITTFFTILSIDQACQAQAITTAFALALAGYTSLHPAILLPVVGMLCYDRLAIAQENSQSSVRTEKEIHGPASTGDLATDQRNRPNILAFALTHVTIFILFSATLLGLSRLLLPSWQFVPSIYLTLLQLPDLTPNPGLWWYFFIEMFDAFRSFFLGVFWLHMLAYSVPFCLRFQKQPLAAVILMMGVIAVFEPYANIGDVGAWLSCMCLLGHTFECEYLPTVSLALR